MTSPADTDLTRWLTERFDRLDDKVDRRIDELSTEVRTTRHGQKASMDQLTTQVVELVTTVRSHEGMLAQLNAWRADEGPLDSRLRRHGKRLDDGEAWRNRFAGGLAVVLFLFPTTVGVIVAITR